MIRHAAVILAIAATAALTGACNKEAPSNQTQPAAAPSAKAGQPTEVEPPTSPTDPAEAASGPASSQPAPAAPESSASTTGRGNASATKNDGNIEATLAAYESARALLAADKAAGLDKAASALERSARAAAKAASAGDRAHFTAIATAAGKLARAKDLPAARAAFAEVSRPLIAILAANPDLAKGRHVFECPMAKGYKKWVQTSADIENPYMGPKMLACGGASDWK